MGFPTYLNRAVQSLGGILSVAEPHALESILLDSPVGLSFDEGAMADDNARMGLDLSLRLLGRLYPQIGVFGPKTPQGAEFEQSLVDILRRVNPGVDLAGAESDCKAVLCFGNSGPGEGRIIASACSWNVEVLHGSSRTLPIGAANPMAAGAAACLGVGEVFRLVFRDSLDDPKLVDLSLSLLEYTPRFTDGPCLGSVHLERTAFVGLGAIANSLAWCLERLPDLRGVVDLVDPDKVDLSNLQRYAICDHVSVGQPKVDVIAGYLARPTLQVRRFAQEFGAYVASAHPDCLFDLLVVSVDNPQTRVAAQATLPRVVVNAWTGDSGLLGASVHDFDGKQACLACLYRPDGPGKGQVDIIADLLGLDAKRVADMLLRGTPLSKELLQQAAQARELPSEILFPWEGRTVADLYTEGICGGALMPIGSAEDALHAVPLAHQSALAGVLLACETVKVAMGIRHTDTPAEVLFDILSPFSESHSRPRLKPSAATCICTDPDYVRLYRQKYDPPTT